jgi:hypothetical protein
MPSVWLTKHQQSLIGIRERHSRVSELTASAEAQPAVMRPVLLRLITEFFAAARW